MIDGPFPETKELIAGYWLWQVKSKAEAIEWVKRCPNPMPGTEAEIEIRQVFESEDFGAEFTPEPARAGGAPAAETRLTGMSVYIRASFLGGARRGGPNRTGD